MISTPPQAFRAAARPIAALSVLVLLALACLPGLAQAESSAGLQYRDAPPTATGTHTIPSNSKSRANSSKANGGDSEANTGGAAGSSDKGSGGGSSSKPGNASQGDGGTGQEQGSRGKKSAGGSQKAGSVETGTPASSQDDDSGSSPLAAILIAIAVLAAISIGAVVMRQRRGGSGEPGDASASPKASS